MWPVWRIKQRNNERSAVDQVWLDRTNSTSISKTRGTSKGFAMGVAKDLSRDHALRRLRRATHFDNGRAQAYSMASRRDHGGRCRSRWKNASLGEMIGTLQEKGIRVPNGFATTAAAYREFLEANEISEKLQAASTSATIPTMSSSVSVPAVNLPTPERWERRFSMSRNSVDCCAPDERDILQRHYKLSALLKANTPDEGASLSFLELAPFL